jgi:zeta-carotene desaturase
MLKHTVIVGGGLSGLAAGVTLATHGVRVTLLEQKPALGGRAYSFADTVTGDTVDNGQHVLIAGYRHTMRFLETIGAQTQVRVQRSPSLLFHHPVRGFRRFSLPPVRSPFNFLAGIAGCSLFNITDRLRLLKAGAALLHSRGEDPHPHLTIREWLVALRQSPETLRSFWEPLAVSIMNEDITVASAALFAHTMRDAFLREPDSAALAIPSVGLSELYVNGAEKYLEERGCLIRTNADVLGVHVGDHTSASVQLKDGQSVQADAVILAVPPHRLARVLPSQLSGLIPTLQRFTTSPIVSVHLWFRNEFMPHEFVGLVGRRLQWLFNKRRIAGEPGGSAHVSAVISGARDFVEVSKDDLVRMAMEDIRSVYPMQHEEPFHAVVVREKSATFSPTPDVEPHRPQQHTVLANVFIAGDWTATGYPATIEGAILSGEKAACMALRVPA